MKKVTIEITSKGWKTTVELEGKTFVDENVLTRYGSEGLNPSLGSQEGFNDDLSETLEDFFCYEVALCLKRLN